MNNELFNRLVDNAGFIKFTSEEDPDTPIDWSCDYTEELKKFADLIIKECTSQVALVGLSNIEEDKHGDIGWTAVKSIEMIKTHFEGSNG